MSPKAAMMTGDFPVYNNRTALGVTGGERSATLVATAEGKRLTFQAARELWLGRNAAFRTVWGWQQRKLFPRFR